MARRGSHYKLKAPSRGGYRPNSGRKPGWPAPLRAADDDFPITQRRERFYVEGSVDIPVEDEDSQGLRALRDQVTPLLRRLGLSVFSEKYDDADVLPLRRRWDHHRRIGMEDVAHEVYAYPSQTVPEVAKALYCQRKPDGSFSEGWNDGDQLTADRKLLNHLTRLCAEDIVRRVRRREDHQTVLVSGSGYRKFITSCENDPASPTREDVEEAEK